MAKLIYRCIVILTVFGLIITGLTACSSGDGAGDTDDPTVNVNVEDGDPGGNTEPADISDASDTSDASDASESDVIDLSSFNSGMTYAALINMIAEPEEYNGRTLVVSGEFATVTDNDVLYYGCVNTDSTACCVQVVEFEPKDQYSYPADFPEEGEPVTIRGSINIIIDGSYQYIVLSDTDIVK